MSAESSQDEDVTKALQQKQSCELVQKWLVLPLPAPINTCEGPEQAAQPSCQPTPYPVMIIREPVRPNQVCAMLDSS